MLKKGQTVRNFKILDTEKRLCSRQWRTYCYIECLLCHRKKWMREDSLKNEKVVSCGCYNKEHNLKAADFTGKTNMV